MNVSSAGANLVSMGDWRETSLDSTFLYHQARAGGMETVTAQSARQILSAVDEIDGRYLGRLVRQARHNRNVRPALRIRDFATGDWGIMARLLVHAGEAQAAPRTRKTNRSALLQRLRGHVHACLEDADAVPLRGLYQGLFELDAPISAAHGREDRVLVDFNAAVKDETKRRAYVFQPRLDDNEALLARALKAVWFEAILSSRKRQARGGTMPLAAYIADECHRFVTSDKVHGEQSFLDTCRSFGVFCVLACQSMSSVKHALAEGNDRTEMNKAALAILLNNTANKLFFRSTDQELQDCVDRLCPVTPGQGRVTWVRPPSTLAPGECYASLTDGRFERRQLLPFGARQDEHAGNSLNPVTGG